MQKVNCFPTLMALIFFSGASACKKYTPTSQTAYDNSSTAGQKLTCKTGKDFITKSDATVSWRATKITPSGEEVVLLGTNAVAGNLSRGNSWATAKAHLDFNGTSTNSEDPMRDSRISSFIFEVPNAIPFGFKLTKIDVDPADAKSFETKIVKAHGLLSVANQEVEIAIPILVKEFKNSITITPAAMFKLNVRSLSPVINGVNLVDQVDRLLALVPGVKMKDEVLIDFLIEFTDMCR